MLEIKNELDRKNQPNIVVIGVGGAGNNAIDRLVGQSQYPVTYVAVNTDSQVLHASYAQEKIQIGVKLTKGFGAGGDSDIGKASAEENESELRAVFEDADMVILTCGMGGGTGTGATPVIARLCHEAGILTVAVVTKPFSFEGIPHATQADSGIEALKDFVDMYVVIQNDKLLEISEKQLLLENAFAEADSVLTYVIDGITNIIFNKGIVNLDFNDLRSVLSRCGIGYFGIGRVSKDASIMDAIKNAIHSPLIEADISGATRVLINTSGKIDIKELNESIQYIRGIVSDSANIMWGTVNNPEDTEDIIVTFIAAGIEETKKETLISELTKVSPPPSPKPFPFKQEKDIVIPTFLQNYTSR